MASRPTTPFIPPNPDRSPARGGLPVIPPPPDNLAVPNWYNGPLPPGGGGGGGGRRSRTTSHSGHTPFRQTHALPIFGQDPTGGGGGVSDDWVGFGAQGPPNPYAGFGGGGPFAGMGGGGGGGGGGANFGMAPPGSAFSAQHNLPPGTPWGWPPSALPTGYSAFQQPLPGLGGGGGGGGHHPNFGQPPLNVMTNFPPGYGGFGGGMGFGGPPSGPGTPWMGGGYVPLTPGESLAPQLPDPVTGVARPKMDVQVDTRWLIGNHYGPVLTPIQATKLGCMPKLNPLLAPPPDDPAAREFLEWNMLFSSAHVHRSSDPPTRSWANGRNAPATFPRVSSLKLVSRHLPWILEVRASGGNGVTCADVIDTLSDFLHEHVPQHAYDALSAPQKTAVHNAYYHNRSRAVGDEVPGGRLGEGMKRCDWLGRDTMFEGIENDGLLVREKLGLEVSEREGREGRRGSGGGRSVPCVFVLRCARRGGVTEDEREANEERGRAGSAASSGGG